jgi:hypothetical protein
VLLACAALVTGYATCVVLAIVVQTAIVLSATRDVALKGNGAPAAATAWPPALEYAITALCAAGWYFAFSWIVRSRSRRRRV